MSLRNASLQPTQRNGQFTLYTRVGTQRPPLFLYRPACLSERAQTEKQSEAIAHRPPTLAKRTTQRSVGGRGPGWRRAAQGRSFAGPPAVSNPPAYAPPVPLGRARGEACCAPARAGLLGSPVPACSRRGLYRALRRAGRERWRRSQA